MSKIYGIPVATPINPGKIDGSGANGKSAYELAVENGFEGTLDDWLNSLVGPPCPVDSTLSVEGQAADAKATGKAILNHVFSTSNPHGVTPAQIGAAPAGYDLVNALSAQGWYKIGTLAPATFDTACATFYIGGSFSNAKPTPSIVDVVITSSGANAKTRVSTHELRQIIKVGLIAETSTLFGVYVFYENNNSNWVKIHADTVNGTFTPADFVASSVAESNMVTVAYLDEWENPPMIPGIEYRTTERWNGKAVWTTLINLGQLTTGALRVNTGITVTNLIRHSGFSKDSSESTSFPALFLASQYDVLGQWIIARTENGTVALTAMRGSGYSRNATIHCQLWYTKD